MSPSAWRTFSQALRLNSCKCAFKNCTEGSIPENAGILSGVPQRIGQSYARNVIGGNIAVKYGYIVTENFQTYNEVCYCDNLEPYILVVMANQSTTEIDKEFIKNVALCADNLVDECYNLNYSAGNLNADGTTDAVDAAMVLNAAANLGTDGKSGLNVKQDNCADVDKSGNIDAVDASYILQYSVYVGAGGTDDAETYFKSIIPSEN